MKKRIIAILSTLSLMGALAGASAYALSGDTMQVNIPFDFVVGSKTLPAGGYTVGTIGPSHQLLIRSVDGLGAVLVANTITADERTARPEPGLDFNRYGDTYFLSRIRMYGEGRELVKGKLERQVIKSSSQHLAENNLKSEVVYIAAQ